MVLRFTNEQDKELLRELIRRKPFAAVRGQTSTIHSASIADAFVLSPVVISVKSMGSISRTSSDFVKQKRITVSSPDTLLKLNGMRQAGRGISSDARSAKKTAPSTVLPDSRAWTQR
ncbi:unnamed protein product [Phytophthora fragariaefolia]|uniref:Unnamed protein product n=1 Tax=Phytophthora fragariaefolia TaxID=1490495 RepID=A0A9W7CYJ2_9STRA|nr:unnamed protein product [Phytophthora fragariaefolia]